MKTDEELVELCRRREARAWEDLVLRYQGSMLNLAFQFTGNREEARDVAQEIFIRLYRSLDRYDSARSFRVWLYSLARNLCIDHYRRKRRDRVLSSVPVEEFRHLESGQERGDERLLRRERQDLLARALNALSTLNREAIVMKDLQNLSHEEMAQALDVPVGTIKSRVSRARVELGRVLLRQQGLPSWPERPDEL